MKEDVEHESKEGQPVQSSQGSRQSFVIFDQSAEAGGPSKGALHHPAPRQEDKTSLGFFEFDDNEANSLLGRLGAGSSPV